MFSLEAGAVNVDVCGLDLGEHGTVASTISAFTDRMSSLLEFEMSLIFFFGGGSTQSFGPGLADTGRLQLEPRMDSSVSLLSAVFKLLLIRALRCLLIQPERYRLGL